MDILPNSEVVRRMRPYQKKLADLIVTEVLVGNAPSSFSEAKDRYLDLLGDAEPFDDGKGWKGDLREASLFCLLKNGFGKSLAVTFKSNGALLNWSGDRVELEAGAALEIEHGGSVSRAEKAFLNAPDVEVYGEGPRCVYVYVDSVLESHGIHYSKIGRHHKSGVGEVLGRVLWQYGTGNPGFPVLKYVFRTRDEVELERQLHQSFRDEHIEGGVGTEWFKVQAGDVLAKAREVLQGAH